MQVTDMPSPVGVLMVDSEWLVWQPLTEAIQRALLLLISPELYPIPSDASTCRYPHSLFINQFFRKCVPVFLIYYTAAVFLASMIPWLCFKLLKEKYWRIYINHIPEYRRATDVEQSI